MEFEVTLGVFNLLIPALVSTIAGWGIGKLFGPKGNLGYGPQTGEWSGLFGANNASKIEQPNNNLAGGIKPNPQQYGCLLYTSPSPRD